MDSAYDQALYEIGDEGKFQKSFDIKYNVFLIFFWSMVYMNIIMSLAITPYTCKYPEKPQNYSDYDWKLKHIPHQTNLKGEITFESCIIYTDPDLSNKTTECDSYIYDTTWYGTTIPSEKNWVCNQEINIANIFAYSKIGEAFGSIFFGWFGDVYGRRATYVLSLSLIVVGRLVSLMAGSSFIIFVVGCIIATLPSWSVPQTLSVISMEMSSSGRRSFTTSLRYTSFSVGLAVMPFLYWWLRDWKTFVIVTTAPLLPFIMFSWNIPESARWLYVEGKSKQCVKLLNKIAQVNNSKLKPDTEKELLSVRKQKSSSSFGSLALFTGARLAFNTILILLLWVFVSICYSVLILSTGEKSDSNPFIQFSIQALAEIPSNFIGAWLCNNIGRRRSASASFFVIGTIWIIVALREMTSVEWLRAWWISTALITIGRLTIAVSFFAINLLNLEIYPTCLRQSGLALGNVVSGMASALAPYILYLGRRVDPRLPGLILGTSCLLSVFISMFLPETLNAKLPETIEDAKVFGSKRTHFSKVSCEIQRTEDFS
ncbi:unnamed protein product [Pieris macdunnoughi]|uniref:Major facilitator superfamily (MFS) profile domain-containing protein n=1 Tax=Pieris macdunnoughi TaxID=345717 RepID=A0A821X7Z9_9NEOP|nr:unnamed protein product [Pieris macdunnoughi]